MMLSRCTGQARALISKQPIPLQLRRYGNVPATVADVGFWKSLVPKAWRRENQDGEPRPKSKGWNPATYFIVMFLFIGSMSIQMIVLRKEMDEHTRRSSVKIALLREIVEKIRNGESVDVEKALGTGDAERESNWEEVLRAIERGETRPKPSKQSESEDKTVNDQDGVRKKTAGIEGFF
ncbi:hypothetical protein CDD80_3021 [Ophiocordyceps camponoti-rufipedis]|uniref:Uncharacterized protein n=1 Tax=Ophiocordyceps camponoti-rufipedis TaxID=2004952 RepID=A0A2C5Z3E4_9HYPO|nr:hypothetical protein CDD80_3021 [Ophiocordyceps camponoti-rufipedis]